MDQKLKLVFGAMCVLLCGFVTGKAALGAALPEGKGKAEFVHNCTACHSAGMVTRVKKTPEEWRKSVDEMAARGTDGTKEDLDNAYLYLVTNYSKEKAATQPATQSPAQPAAPPSFSQASVFSAWRGIASLKTCCALITPGDRAGNGAAGRAGDQAR